MAFRFRVGKQAFVDRECTCPETGAKETDYVPVLVLARITEESFAEKTESYRVADSEGCSTTVEEHRLMTQAEVDTLLGADAEPEVETDGEVEEPKAEEA